MNANEVISNLANRALASRSAAASRSTRTTM
jgi:hypothetical protein